MTGQILGEIADPMLVWKIVEQICSGPARIKSTVYLLASSRHDGKGQAQDGIRRQRGEREPAVGRESEEGRVEQGERGGGVLCLKMFLN